MRCPKCLEPLTHIYTQYDKFSLLVCENKDCDVEDGIYQDKMNLLGFGKDEYVVHIPTYAQFIDEAEKRYYREYELKQELKKENLIWKKKYEHTFDYQVIQRVKSLISSVKRFIREKLLMK